MQSDLEVGLSRITGTLKYVDGEGWDSGTWGSDEAAGHFVALKAVNVPEGAVVTVEVINGEHGPVTLDSDLNCILRIKNPASQSIKITASLNGKTESRTYALNQLVLEPET